MPIPVRTPRVNNNDDSVKLSHVFPEIGSRIRQGDPIADVETDKATFTVESEHEGFLLAVNAKVGDIIDVGSILAWIGAAPDEPVDAEHSESAAANNSSPEPTLKALLLLKHF